MNKVLVGGCFDILHFGHIKFLNKAKTFGNHLIVALESDANVKKLKGDGRPIHNQRKRHEMLLSLKSVDEVIILKDKMSDKDYFALMKKVKPSVIVITEGDPMRMKKKKQADEVGTKLVEIRKFQSPSTSEIIKKLKLF